MAVISKTRKTEPLVIELSTNDAEQAVAGFRGETGGGVPASFAEWLSQPTCTITAGNYSHPSSIVSRGADDLQFFGGLTQ
jgi:hypothetical protein